MKIIALFNNKGGVGKTTLCYHLGCALGELEKKVLLVDLDPQCNLTISALKAIDLEHIWEQEDDYIEDFESSCNSNPSVLSDIIQQPRSIHFLLKPAEDGVSDISELPAPLEIYGANVHLFPGRLSLHKFENKIAERWNGIYQGDNLSIRTVTNIRTICQKYASRNGYDYVIIDTSPSLGILNKTIISTSDGFFIPAFPDMFSLYGIRNIGNSLNQWQNDFDTIYRLISKDKRKHFPSKFVQFIGYTLYNAKKYTANNDFDLADAHYRYAKTIPDIITKYIDKDNRAKVTGITDPIGGKAIMHTHNTFPSVSQLLKCPFWDVPKVYSRMRKEDKDYLMEYEININQGHFGNYTATKDAYLKFASSFIKRVEAL